MNEKILKVAVIGCGGISGAHIPNWLKMEGVEVIGVCDIEPEKMQRYPRVPHFNSYDEMLENCKPDILDICLPTYLHYEYALKAMNAGINVITEKPISLKQEHIDALYDAAKKNNVKFMVAQCLRFWAEYELVKEYYESSKYGRLLSANLWRLGGYPTKDWYKQRELSGLIPFDLHIHDLDFMIYALGRPQAARCFRARDDSQDYIQVLYQYPGFFITAQAAWFNSDYRFRSGFRFQFEHALLEYKDGKMTIYRENDTPIQVTGASDEGKDITQVGSNAYLNEIRYFVDCVLEGKPCDEVKPKELIDVLEMIEIIDQA